MNKKETLIPFAFVALSMLFIIISAIVYFSKGKSKYWVAKKIKIGAIILTLNTASISLLGQEITCYLPSPVEHRIDFFITSVPEIRLNLKKEIAIEGVYYSRQPSKLSFIIKRLDGFIVQQNDARINDGKVDEKTEEFLIYLDPDIVPGEYYIEFYPFDKKNLKIHENVDVICKQKLIIEYE